MPPFKTVLKFSVALLFFAALFLAPWPPVRRAYAAYFRGLGNTIFSRFWFWPDGTVRFLDPLNIQPGQLAPAGLQELQRRAWVAPPDSRHGAHRPQPAVDKVKDTLLVLENRQNNAAFGFLRTSSRYVGYMPMATLAAFILATPAKWRRRGIAFLWGLLFIHVFVILRLTLMLAVGFNGTKGYSLFQLTPFWSKTLGYLENILQDDPTVSFVVPAFLWLVLLFRPSQWTAGTTPKEEKAEAK